MCIYICIFVYTCKHFTIIIIIYDLKLISQTKVKAKRKLEIN